MKKTLTKALVAFVVSFGLLSCAAKPKYHMFEGPPRLELKVPHTVRTGQRFIIKARVLGENGQLPFDQYVTIVVSANDQILGVRSFIFKDRNLTGTLIFSPEFFNMFAPRSTRGRNPTDYVDPVPAQVPMDYDENDPDVKVKIKLEIWLSEVNYKNEIQPVKRILQKSRNTKLSCMDQRCQNAMY